MTSWLGEPNNDLNSQSAYVAELLEAQVEIWSTVVRAQQARGAKNLRRAERAGTGHVLEVGAFVVMKRSPDAVRNEQGLDRGVSNRLVPRAEGRVWQVLAKKRPHAFLLADAATGGRHKHAVVELVIEELVEPIDQRAELEADGVRRTVKKQAVDGRALIKWEDETETWEDLATLDFLWV